MARASSALGGLLVVVALYLAVGTPPSVKIQTCPLGCPPSTSTALFECCGGQCVDVMRSDANCLACSNICPAGSRCCGSTGCVDVASSDSNCGACGNACPAGSFCCGSRCIPRVSNFDSSNCGACGNQCESGTVCCSGSCISTAADPMNCGSCGKACANSGYLCCSGSCVAQSDLRHLGGSGDTCDGWPPAARWRSDAGVPLWSAGGWAGSSSAPFPGRVLLAFGFADPKASGPSVLKRALEYNTTDGTWRRLADAPVALAAGAGVSIVSPCEDGLRMTFYSSGGYSEAGVAEDRIFRYDLAADSWSVETARMATGRAHHASAVLRGQLIFVAGGAGTDLAPLSSVEVYNTQANAWFKRRSLPHPLRDAVALAAEDGLLVWGGMHADRVTAEVLRYSFEEDYWVPVLRMPEPRGAFALARTGGGDPLHSGSVFVAGGYGRDLLPLSSAWEFLGQRRGWRAVPAPPKPAFWSAFGGAASAAVKVFGGVLGSADLTAEGQSLIAALEPPRPHPGPPGPL